MQLFEIQNAEELKKMLRQKVTKQRSSPNAFLSIYEYTNENMDKNVQFAAISDEDAALWICENTFEDTYKHMFDQYVDFKEECNLYTKDAIIKFIVDSFVCGNNLLVPPHRKSYYGDWCNVVDLSC